MLRRIGAIALVALALPAAAQARWSEPAAGTPALRWFANNARGDRIAATEDPSDFSATVALAVAGRGWGKPRTLPVKGFPEVAIGPRGDALVAVTSYDGTDVNCCHAVTVLRLTPDGRVAATMQLEPPGMEVQLETMAIADSRHFAVGYRVVGRERVRVAAGATELAPAADLAGDTPVAFTLGPKRQAVLARHPDGVPVERIVGAGGALGPPLDMGEALGDPARIVPTLAIAADAHGRQVAGAQTAADGLVAAFRDPGRRFTVQRIDSNGEAPVVSVAPSGAAALLWTTEEFIGSGSAASLPWRYALWIATRKPGGRFGTPRAVFASTHQRTTVIEPRVAVDSRGDVAVLYGVEADSKAVKNGLFVTTGTLAHPVGRRHQLATSSFWFSDSQNLTIDPRGRLRADWLDAFGSLTAAGP